jgi:peroxiredoxin
MTKLFSTLFILFCFSSFCVSQSSANLPDERGYIVKVGDVAPDFTISFPDGSPSKKLSELKGNVVMLQFTASWCSVCIKEMPHIENQIWKPLKNKGLYLFGVDRKEKPEDVLKFARKTKVTYPLIMDEDGKIFELYAAPNAGVTRNVIIDKEGKIVFLTRLFDENEFNEMVKKIETLLKG